MTKSDSKGEATPKAVPKATSIPKAAPTPTPKQNSAPKPKAAPPPTLELEAARTAQDDLDVEHEKIT